MKRILLLSVFLMSCGTIVPTNKAAKHVYLTTGCSRVRVERVHNITLSNGKKWVVVRLNVCGEKMVFEKRGTTWRDITWRVK
jgi:hypothetical protein